MRLFSWVSLISTLITAFALGSRAHASSCEFMSADFDSTVFKLNSKSFRVDRQTCHLGSGATVSTLRSFDLSGQPYSLVVDQERLVTAIIQRECLRECVNGTGAAGSPYNVALATSTASPQPLQDGGIRHAVSDKLQMFLTADLCPSEKPLVRDIFERVLSAKGNLAQSPVTSLVAAVAPDYSDPIPAVALSVSGEWLMKHEADLDYLKNLEHSGQWQITWVNHTFTHPYNPALPIEHNFILRNGVNFSREILENEKLMLKDGLVPSIFVRFPGLVSDQAHMDQLRQWGLVPLGADAWLAKGQKPTNGSIILVHANGNEPKGIAIFDDLLNRHSWWVKIFKSLPNALLD